MPNVNEDSVEFNLKKRFKRISNKMVLTTYFKT